ncbi:MAG: right-handed parallel beta-helix repeat-containing protein, partial [Candidatus Aminicenantes bacterium]|nr:right-handed parallel beta-helix repeat-containing protein [Candidatus Aminicenantes bacterium]
MRKLAWLLVFTLSAAAYRPPPRAETPTVSSVQELMSALARAATNQKPDIINLAAGTYDFDRMPGPILYQPQGRPQPPETYPITIQGAGTELTILEGRGKTGFLFIDTTKLNDAKKGRDSAVHVTVSDMTFKDAGPGSPLTVGTLEATTRIHNVKCLSTECAAGGSTLIVSSEKGVIILGNSLFSGSEISPTSSGAVLSSRSGSISVTGCTFARNRGQKDGIGLLAMTNTGVITVGKNSFENNGALGHTGPLAIVIGGKGAVGVVENRFIGNNGARGCLHVQAIQEGGAVIEKNNFTDNSSWGVWFETMNGAVELKANRFIRNLDGGARLGAGPGLGSAELVNNVLAGESHGIGALVEIHTVTVVNNTFASYREGLRIVQAKNTAAAKIYNNILWGHQAADISIKDDDDSDGLGGRVELHNNDFSTLEVDVGDKLARSGNLDIDPHLFMVDFHLYPYSPVIDKGLPGAPGLPDKDFEGDSRTVDANGDSVREPDMGADEVAEYKEAPRVVTTHPKDGAVNVPLDSLITATFSMRMSVSSLDLESFTVRPA